MGCKIAKDANTAEDAEKGFGGGGGGGDVYMQNTEQTETNDRNNPVVTNLVHLGGVLDRITLTEEAIQKSFQEANKNFLANLQADADGGNPIAKELIERRKAKKNEDVDVDMTTEQVEANATARAEYKPNWIATEENQFKAIAYYLETHDDGKNVDDWSSIQLRDFIFIYIKRRIKEKKSKLIPIIKEYKANNNESEVVEEHKETKSNTEEEIAIEKAAVELFCVTRSPMEYGFENVTTEIERSVVENIIQENLLSITDSNLNTLIDRALALFESKYPSIQSAHCDCCGNSHGRLFTEMNSSEEADEKRKDVFDKMCKCSGNSLAVAIACHLCSRKEQEVDKALAKIESEDAGFATKNFRTKQEIIRRRDRKVSPLGLGEFKYKKERQIVNSSNSSMWRDICNCTASCSQPRTFVLANGNHACAVHARLFEPDGTAWQNSTRSCAHEDCAVGAPGEGNTCFMHPVLLICKLFFFSRFQFPFLYLLISFYCFLLFFFFFLFSIEQLLSIPLVHLQVYPN